jgi:Cu(I)/Ag(I) efflux system membrane fusion protein
MNDSPFEPAERSSRGRLLRISLLVAALVATAAVAYVLTRKPADSAAAGHGEHAAAGADSAQPVMLSAEDAARIGVTFAEVTVGSMAREVRTVAQVSYDETRVATVALKVDGWVEQLVVNITGQPVRKGEPLLELYSPMLVSAQQELLIAHRLAADVGAGTPSARAGADELLQAARRRLAYWDVPPDVIAAIEQSGQVRKAVGFVAPVNGIVVEKRVLAGQRIMAGEPLYKIADLSRVWLEGEVFEPDLPAARLGLAVTAEFPALPGTQRVGRITYVYPTLNPETRTGRIRVELSNNDLALKPGMYATIRFRAAARPGLSVPRSAVLATGERNLVFVKDADGTLTPRNVSLGAATDDRIEILSGLVKGEQVVASGTFLLDAESNLGAALGGMGNMPGMDLKAPTSGPAPRPSPTAPPRKGPAPGDTALQAMPGMAAPAPRAKADTLAPPAGGADAHPNY